MVELLGGIDLQKYMGNWYEMARKPAFFQRSCVQARAKYVLQKDAQGRPFVEVLNTCIKENGKESKAVGEAKIKGERQLAVKFSIFMNPFNRTNYEVIFIDEAYEVAVVGSPDKKYLWILSRQILPRHKIDILLNIAKTRGFDIRDVVFDQYQSM